MIKKVMIVLVMFSINHAFLAHALEISHQLGVAYYTWKEYTSLGTVKESGPIGTLGWSLSSSLPPEAKTLMAHAHFEIFGGQVDYDTKTQIGIPVNTNTDYLGFKVEGSMGWAIVLRSTYESMEQLQKRIKTKKIKILKTNKKRIVTFVEPFVGLAFRYWDRVIESSVDVQGNPASGSVELYSNIYARIGTNVSHMLNGHTTLYANFSLDPMLWASERVDIGQILVLSNGKRLGWEVEAGTRIKQVNFDVYWQATRLEKSNVVGCCFQPKSDQDIIGIKFGYLF